MVFPANTALPMAMAAVTGLFFLGMLFKLYWLVPAAALGVLALALRWVWGLGARQAEGPLPVGHGLSVPTASEVTDPPGWWGSLFLLLADGTFFGSLLFGYAFLFTIAPNWPPPAWAEPGLAGPALALVGLAAVGTGLRLGRGARAGTGLAATGAGLVALILAAGAAMASAPDPSAHAFDATVWVLAGYVALHAALALVMCATVALRIRAGYVSAAGEAAVARLWSAYAAATGAVALAAAWAPGALT